MARRVRADSKLVMLRDDAHGRKRVLEVIDLADLHVDLDYQREFKQHLLERILQDYDPLAADPLDISMRDDGSLWIINGQHHALAAQQTGESEALAWVYTGLTPQQEADFRLKKNNSSADTSLEKFHAKLKAATGEDERLRELYAETATINQLCKEFGTVVNQINNKHHGINCVSALESVFRIDNGLLLRNTFQMLRDSFGELHGEVVTADSIRGVAWFLRQHSSEVSRTDVRGKLSRAGVDDIMRKARAHKSAMGGALWINFYRAMVEVYNHRRSEQNRIEWRTKFKHTLDKGLDYAPQK